MKNKNHRYRIFLSPPYQSGSELQSLSEVLDSNWLAPGGVHVERFEQSSTLRKSLKLLINEYR